MPLLAVCLPVSAQHGKAIVSNCPRGFSSSTGFPDCCHCGDDDVALAACQESLYSEDVPRDNYPKSVTCLSSQ
ncbi:MAG: hypothetical protein J5486_06770 [Bacteroidaceae bacterium]|nr:hypothetical protein [Bacteroidaceae bacterium]